MLNFLHFGSLRGTGDNMVDASIITKLKLYINVEMQNDQHFVLILHYHHPLF